MLQREQAAAGLAGFDYMVEFDGTMPPSPAEADISGPRGDFLHCTLPRQFQHDADGFPSRIRDSSKN